MRPTSDEKTFCRKGKQCVDGRFCPELSAPGENETLGDVAAAAKKKRIAEGKAWLSRKAYREHKMKH